MTSHIRKILFPQLLTVVPSNFNLDAFASSSFEGEGDTRRLRLEEKEYRAVVQGPWADERGTRLFTSDKGALALIVVWQLDDEEQRAKLNLEKMPTKRQTVWLDLTKGGALDMGPYKNSELNRLRDVFGLNAPGKQWKFPDFVGQVAMVKLKNQTNKEDPENPFQNITAVSPA